jgi:hypothetical protein
MKFIPALGIHFRIPNSCTRQRKIFKGLSQDGRRAEFSESLRASLFNKDLLNEPDQSLWTLPVKDYSSTKF